MKKIILSVFLSVCMAVALLGGKVPALEATLEQNGVMLTFNSLLGSTSSGNFWFNDAGRQMVFTESNGDKRISLTFTNYGENTVDVQLLVVSADFQQRRGSVKVTVPAKESANAELMNLDLQENDVFYFYASGLTPETKLSFKANYAEVDYTVLTPAALQGPGASAFTAQVLYADTCRITLAKKEHVRYTVVLNHSIFSTCRNQTEAVLNVCAGDVVEVIAACEEGWLIDSLLFNTEPVTRLSRCTFTAKEDSTIEAQAITAESAVASGVYLEFHEKLTATKGDFWLNETGLAMFCGSDEAKSAELVFTNYDTEEITAMLRVVSASMQEVRFAQSVVVPAGGIAMIEAENVALAPGDIVYLHLSDIKPTSRLGFFAGKMDYTALTAVSMQGTGTGTFSVKLDAAKPVTVSGLAAEGAVYNVTFNGRKTPHISGAASFEEVVAAGTLVTVEAMGENVEGLLVEEERKGAVYSFRAENDCRLCAAVSDKEKVQNGLTLAFFDNLSSSNGNFWLKQAEDLTFTMAGDTRLSATLFNEGKGEVAAILRVVDKNWKTLAQNKKIVIPAGESRTIEFMNMAVPAEGDLYYLYLENLTAQTKLRLVFNQTDVDYSAFTTEVMEGTGADTFVAYTERVEPVRLKLEKNQGVTYTVSVNDSVFALYSKVDSLDTAFLPNTKIEVIAHTPEGRMLSGWEKDGAGVGGEKLTFTLEKNTVCRALMKESTASPSDNGDTALFLPAVGMITAGTVLVFALKKRKQDTA